MLRFHVNVVVWLLVQIDTGMSNLVCRFDPQEPLKADIQYVKVLSCNKMKRLKHNLVEYFFNDTTQF